jgi:hypothetical protein
LPLIVRVNKSHQITQHNTMLMTEARTRQNHCGKRRIGNMNRQTGRQQSGSARRQLYGVIETGSQIKAGRTGGGVGRQWNCLPTRGSRILTSIFSS